MLDLIVRNAAIHGEREPQDIACRNGKIVEIGPAIRGEAGQEVDAGGNLVTPPFVDSHFHMDATLSMGMPRLNQDGTLLEGIRIWGELKPDLTAEGLKARAMKLLSWSVARGNLAIRTHVDTTDPSLMAVDVLLEVRDEMKDVVDIQLVAFPQDGLLRSPDGVRLMHAALDRGVDVVGGIPHFERTMEQGRESVRILCELAAGRGLMVDMHCDESDDPLSRHIETLTFETQRLGLHGRVAGSHLTSMHSMDNYYVSKLLPLMAEARINCICNPLVNMNLQGRHDTYPKRRGLMRVPELMACGVNVALGHDDVMDPWYPMGTHDMLEVAHMGAHALHMTGVTQQESLFDAVTANGAKTLGLTGYGLTTGCNADMVVLQATTKMEALRLRPARLFVIRRGRVIAATPEVAASVDLGTGPQRVDFR
ncbi:MAG: amidohydrolase family protein [Pseudodesulfovibrio sp.]|uniref:Cytosine deaminase n=1 Tax=Pseudodesulfovibrio aespoeensis (strain ATCC 700646 / DSM 10631 / Aspo-2) TaxID=643562 RepID=E6VS63_PSEA9|nr:MULTISPECIES: amidohydrolase family protein [Pseudodesulfovibrio]MBU4191312.1 amidohydrolase family protein [Pseudomonadota bacterium]ADU63108.1 Cytosine deaminase [Pseudodesulfovibrio aespoeensis Aspo-2]MBU4243240.1 amidohydrolase family protein [Pseudomonadota bacterium]MBU4378708.1 amidohydrolase family protein [Pseudomonadota bacterium]MBU4474116.1 amidohydrolase family protein [Pseudomonadota bacterium]